MALFKNTNRIIVAEIFSALFKILTTIIVTRSLGVENYSIWSLFFTLLSFFELIAKIQFDTASIYLVGKKKVHKNEAFFITTLTASIIFLIIAVFTFFYFNHIATIFFLDKSNLIFEFKIFFIISLLFTVFLTISQNFLLVQTDIKNYQKSLFIYWTVCLFSNLTLVYYFDYGISGVILSFFILPNIICVLFCFIKIFFVNNVRFKLSIRKFNLFLILSSKLYFLNIVTNIFNTGTRLYFASISNIVSFGFFSLAYSLSFFINYLIPTSVGTILTAMLPKKNINEKNRVMIVTKVFRVCFYLMIITVITTIPIMQYLIILAFGEDYSKTYYYFCPLVLSLGLYCVSGVFSSYFFSIEKVGTNIKIMILTSMFNFLLIFIANIYFSFDIVVFFFLISNLFLFILRFFYFIKFSKAKLNEFLFETSDFVEVFNFVKKNFFKKKLN